MEFYCNRKEYKETKNMLRIFQTDKDAYDDDVRIWHLWYLGYKTWSFV